MHGSDQIMVREAENKPNEVGLQGHRSSNGRLNGYFTPAKVNSAPLRNVKYEKKKETHFPLVCFWSQLCQRLRGRNPVDLIGL